jgi:hypothetical protein
MKNIGLALFFSIYLFSCKEISFPTPQPAGLPQLKEVPATLLGKYTSEEDNSKNDSLIIERWGYRFVDGNDKDWLGKGTLSDSMVIKKYKDYYFVSFRTQDQWTLRLIKQQSNGDFTFLKIDVGDDDRRKEILKKISQKLKVTEFKKNDSDTFYQINPTPDQLMQLIKEGYFTGTELKKVAWK